MAVTKLMKEVLWLKGLVGDLSLSQEDMIVFCYN